MKEIDLVYRTMFAELCERTMDAAFESEFDLAGRFVPVEVRGRIYWYYDRSVGGANKRVYVGPAADGAITRRVEAFRTLKDDRRSRRKLISTLTREAGFQRSEAMTGDVVAALATAGLFRLRGVLVGTVAYQCLGAVLGVRLPSTAMQTGDADLAQFHSISAAVGDSLPPVIELLRAVDASFREVPHHLDGRVSTRFVSGGGYQVEFLTPNVGKAEYGDMPARMPALGGAVAQPLRFLDFLIHEPIRSVLLHGDGVPVTVPSPERFAVHKLIVATRRRQDAAGFAKAAKDLHQAVALATALALTRRHTDLATVWTEAWARGPAWRKALKTGLSYLKPGPYEALRDPLLDGLDAIGIDATEVGMAAPRS